MTSPFNDGSAQAPAGAPQLPTLLSGYTARPPWDVAGVNYAVGVPAGTPLKDPAGISMPGVTVDTAQHLLQVTGSNVTLNGYDFGLAGGWGITIQAGATNTVIENSNFYVGSNNQMPISADSGSGNLTLQYNTINGGAGQNNAVWALVNYNGSGTFSAQYNSFLNAPEDAIDFNGGTITPTVQYNVFDNLGTSAGSHPDPVQYVGDAVNNALEQFNTIYQPQGGGEVSGMQGLQLQAQDGSTITNATLQNNVIVATGPSLTMSYSIAVIQDSGNTINGATVANNFIDETGAYGAFYPPSGSNLAFVNNVDMVNGTNLSQFGTSPPGTVPGSIITSAVGSNGKLLFIDHTAEAQVARLYQAAFGRAPDAAGGTYWSQALHASASLVDIAGDFLASPEFETRYGNPDNATFVTELYQNVLHRPPDSAGLAYWQGSLDSGAQTRAQVLVGFSESPENEASTPPSADAQQAARLYWAEFDRAPDAPGLTFWTNQLSNGAITLSQEADALAAGPEFIARYDALGATAFVTQLYENVLGRAPDAAGLASWTTALANGSSRGSVVVGFSESAEAQAHFAPVVGQNGIVVT